MSKRAKAIKAGNMNTPAPVVEAPKVEVQAAPVAKLTKRNATPTNAMLVATDKAPKSRAPHVKNAWEAVLAALPNTAAELAKLEPLAVPECVSPSAFLSYMQRRGFLKVQGE